MLYPKVELIEPRERKRKRAAVSTCGWINNGNFTNRFPRKLTSSPKNTIAFAVPPDFAGG
jgi:hypothetical protein